MTQQGEHQAETARHMPWLAPVRMLVIMLIALGYASTMPRGPQFQEYLNVLGYDPSWVGISIIFMLSGFLALASLNRHGSAFKLLLSRASRNLPILVLFALSVIFVLFPIFGDPAPGGIAQHTKYFARVVSCIDPNHVTPGLLDNALYMCIVQGGLWTFRWGVIAYIGAAVLWRTGIVKQRMALPIITILALAGYAALVQMSTRAPLEGALDLAGNGLRLAWPFLVGMTMFQWRNQLPRNLFVPAALLGVAVVNYYILPWTPMIDICLSLGCGYLAWLAATSTVKLPAALNGLPDLSLGLYVFNWPAAQIILLLIPGLSPLGLFALSFPATILLSYGAWYIVSRPVNKRVTGLLATA